jgi:hypothetical protein
MIGVCFQIGAKMRSTNVRQKSANPPRTATVVGKSRRWQFPKIRTVISCVASSTSGKKSPEHSQRMRIDTRKVSQKIRYNHALTVNCRVRQTLKVRQKSAKVRQLQARLDPTINNRCRVLAAASGAPSSSFSRGA